MREKGVRFQLGLGRQAFQVDGKFKFWGGLACHIWGGGKEMIKALHGRADARAASRSLYETPAVGLLQGDRGVEGVRVRRQGRAGRPARQGGGARLRRVRGQCRDAGALSRAGLGPRQGARHPLQHRRRAEDGARHRRGAGRALVGRACRRLGPQRAAVRRPRCRRPLPEAQLSVRHRRQCQGRALSRRGRRLPQLHLCQIRRRDPEAARHVRLADLRPEDRASAARRIPHPAHHQGKGRHASRHWPSGSKASTRQGFLETVRAFNAAPRPDVPFNPNIHDGLRTSGPGDRQDQLGAARSTRRPTRPTR